MLEGQISWARGSARERRAVRHGRITTWFADRHYDTNNDTDTRGSELFSRGEKAKTTVTRATPSRIGKSELGLLRQTHETQGQDEAGRGLRPTIQVQETQPALREDQAYGLVGDKEIHMQLGGVS